MTKFIGNLVVSLFFVAIATVVVKSLPDVARYIKLREM
jgi:hypothetical protein